MKPCCQDLSNRETQKPQKQRQDLTVSVCRACGCRHFEVTVDPGKLGLRGQVL